MRKFVKTGILATSFTVLTGFALIGGNHLFVSNVLAAELQPAGISVSSTDIQASVPQINAVTQSVTLSTTSGGERHETLEVPSGGEMTADEAKRLGVDSIAKELNLSAVELENFSASVSNYLTAEWPSEVADKLSWSVRLTPKNAADYPLIEYHTALFSDTLDYPVNVHTTHVTKEGNPAAGEMQEDEAKEALVKALTEEFALSQELLNKFTVTAKYYEVTAEAPGRHAWWVNLYPTLAEDFAETGAYWGYIDAATGDVVKLCSPADAIG